MATTVGMKSTRDAESGGPQVSFGREQEGSLNKINKINNQVIPNYLSMALKNKNKTKETDTKDSRLQQKLKRRENSHQRPKEYNQNKANEHTPQLLNHTSKKPHIRATCPRHSQQIRTQTEPSAQTTRTTLSYCAYRGYKNGWPPLMG